LEKVNEIVSPGYLPNLDDILRSRAATSGLVELKFDIDGNTFVMLDVGGQRSERKKWINCFSEVTAVIFIGAMSVFDQVLFEDDKTNRMREAIKVFKDVLFQQWFDNTAFIFFFNKKDLFEQKIQTSSVKDYFPDEHAKYASQYPDLANLPDVYERESTFVEKLFMDHSLFFDPENPMENEEDFQRLENYQRWVQEKEIYTHHTCATDTNHIKIVFDIVKDIVVKRGLQRAGLM